MAWGPMAAMMGMQGMMALLERGKNKKAKAAFKEMMAKQRHVDPYQYKIPKRYIKKFGLNKGKGFSTRDYRKLKKNPKMFGKRISGKSIKRLGSLAKADKLFRQRNALEGGGKGQFGDFQERQMMGNMGMAGRGRIKKKDIQKFKKREAKQRKYQRQDWGKVRRYEMGAAKGKNVRQISGFNKQQQELMKKLPADALKQLKSGKMDITKNKNYREGEKYINKALKEKPLPRTFKKYPEHISRRSMKDIRNREVKEFKKDIMPEIMSRYSGGRGNNSALQNALANAEVDLRQKLREMDFQRKQANIGYRTEHAQMGMQHQAMREQQKAGQREALARGLMSAQAPVENAQNLANLAQAREPNQNYFLPPPALKQAFLRGEPQQQMPFVPGGGQQQQMPQQRPGMFGNFVNAMAAGGGQALGQMGIGALFGNNAGAAGNYVAPGGAAGAQNWGGMAPGFGAAAPVNRQMFPAQNALNINTN